MHVLDSALALFSGQALDTRPSWEKQDDEKKCAKRREADGKMKNWALDS